MMDFFFFGALAYLVYKKYKTSYTPRFTNLVSVVLRHEGGYSNIKGDSGGKTMYGISDARDGKTDGVITYGERDIPVQNLTIDDAKNIYYNEYYKPLRLDEIVDERLALHIFDMGVNAGIYQTVELLCDLLKMKRRRYIDDLIIRSLNGDNYVRKFSDLRKRTYRSMAKGGKAKFLKSWISRVENCDTVKL